MTSDLAPPDPALPDLQADVLRSAYAAGTCTVRSVVAEALERIAARGDDGVWISRTPPAAALRRADELDVALAAARVAGRVDGLPPLFGLPYAVKDNIDVAGLPTTAGCPAFAYSPDVSAPLVRALDDAGAVCLGKTNLDQFATGLSGVRSPYGTPVSPFDARFVAGGSSSGSGVAVAAGLVSFAIGTDTAGSGRVPAAFSNTVGLKPSRGLVSTVGIVPACRSLDCPSVFALSVPDARRVLSVIAGFDPDDPYSRRFPASVSVDGVVSLAETPAGAGRRPARALGGLAGRRRTEDRRPWRLGVPAEPVTDGDPESGPGGAAVFTAAFAAALGLARAGGAELVEVDLAPFLAAGDLLYGGPWLAERYAGVGAFIDSHPDDVHPVVRAVVAPGAEVSGAEVFRGQARLAELRRATEPVWADVDALVVPTVAGAYTLAQMRADPIGANARLGRYTTFANLLDLAGLAVPTGFAGGLPFGVTLLGPAGSDALLAEIGADLHTRAGLRLGAGAHPLTVPKPADATPAIPKPADATPAVPVASNGAGPPAETFVDLAVVGAHMSGLPLNAQLRRAGATLARRDRTIAGYRFFALPGGPPHRPGLLRVEAGGVAIDAEVWRVPAARLGDLVAQVPAPLTIGTVELAGGPVLGFLCESYATGAADDISATGGWRAYLAGREPASP